jgi:chlorite dismutase
MSSRIQELLEMLHTMITEAWGLPLGAEKCVIERDKALDLLDEIRAQFPTEIAEAKRLIDARSEFINNARREAESIKRNADEQAKQMLDEQEIIRITRTKCDEMLSSAAETTNELKRVVSEYVEDAMQRTEDTLATALNEIQQSRIKFQQVSKAVMPTNAAPHPLQEDPETDPDIIT